MIEITDFVALGPVEPEVIEAYRDRVPDELIEIWEHYGYGSFGEGFVRIINPQVYEDALTGALGKVTGEGIAVPFMVTGLADVICWEPGEGVIAIMYRDGRVEGLGTRMKTFFNLARMDGTSHFESTLNWEMFPPAVAAHGPLAHEESFMFVPLLSLGGPKKVENMHKRPTLDGIKVMVEFQGVIEH